MSDLVQFFMLFSLLAIGRTSSWKTLLCGYATAWLESVVMRLVVLMGHIKRFARSFIRSPVSLFHMGT